MLVFAYAVFVLFAFGCAWLASKTPWGERSRYVVPMYSTTAVHPNVAAHMLHGFGAVITAAPTTKRFGDGG